MEALATLGGTILATRPLTAKAMSETTVTKAARPLWPWLRTAMVPTMPALVGGIHGAWRSLRLRASLRVLTAILAFHRRAAEAFWSSALAVTTMALMRRVHRAALPIAPAGSARPAHALESRSIAILRTLWTLLVAVLSGWRWCLWDCRWVQRGCRRKRRWGWGFSILG